jgi:hypothetical protein
VYQKKGRSFFPAYFLFYGCFSVFQKKENVLTKTLVLFIHFSLPLLT